MGGWSVSQGALSEQVPPHLPGDPAVGPTCGPASSQLGSAGLRIPLFLTGSLCTAVLILAPHPDHLTLTTSPYAPRWALGMASCWEEGPCGGSQALPVPGRSQQGCVVGAACRPCEPPALLFLSLPVRLSPSPICGKRGGRLGLLPQAGEHGGAGCARCPSALGGCTLSPWLGWDLCPP